MGNKLILKKGYFHTITGNNGTGKSRTLTELSKNSLDKINKNNDFSRMICLSGTVFERFIIPKKMNLIVNIVIWVRLLTVICFLEYLHIIIYLKFFAMITIKIMNSNQNWS